MKKKTCQSQLVHRVFTQLEPAEVRCCNAINTKKSEWVTCTRRKRNVWCYKVSLMLSGTTFIISWIRVKEGNEWSTFFLHFVSLCKFVTGTFTYTHGVLNRIREEQFTKKILQVVIKTSFSHTASRHNSITGGKFFKEDYVSTLML